MNLDQLAALMVGADPIDLISAYTSTRPAWTAHAACRGQDPALFFPERGHSAAPARNICDTCPVQFACLRHALDNPSLMGIWGGLTERERDQIRRGGTVTYNLDEHPVTVDQWQIEHATG